MGILSRAGDMAYTLRFLRLLTTPWTETNAYKLGLIDDTGKKLRKPVTQEEKSAYNYFHRLVFNLKKLLNKIPGGKSKVGSYVAALLLIKEQLNLSDKSVQKIIEASEIDELDFLEESTQWFCTKDRMLSPGVYKLAEGNKMFSNGEDDICRKGDRIKVEMDTYPRDSIMGIDIYEVVHVPSQQSIYVSAGELRR